MADSKISALTAATTPLAGTEVLPIVQSGVTKKVAVADLTAGRAVSAASLTLTSTPLAVGSGGTGLSSLTNRGIPYATSTSALTTSTALQFNGTGIGMAVTPSAWGSGNPAIDIGSWVAFGNGYGADASWNAYYDGTNWRRKLPYGVGCALYTVGDQSHTFRYAASGAQDSVISWSTVFTTDSSGNLVQGGASKGFNFTANTGAAGMTSQLLNWYEEGTWTPNDASGAGLTLTVLANSAKYTRVGRMVTATFAVSYPSTASALQAAIGGLPFTSGTGAGQGGYVVYTSLANIPGLNVSPSSTIFYIYGGGGTGLSNTNMSTQDLRGVVVYFV